MLVSFQSCHEAYALASAISGVTQLVALLSGVIFIWVVKLCRTLGITSLIGCISFAVLGRSALGSIFGAENPNNWLTWLATIGIGLAQTGSVTLSLAMITRNREQLHTGTKWGDDGVPDEDRSYSSEITAEEDGADEEMSGALAGVYSFCGGEKVLNCWKGYILITELMCYLLDRSRSPFGICFSSHTLKQSIASCTVSGHRGC